jgi:hypothetical protein
VIPVAGLKPWREVLPPHADVTAGNVSAGEFAADLHLVAFAPDAAAVGPEYRDPAEFFRRTHLTEGLRELLDRAVRRLSGDPNASPVLDLQAGFGGGKTHAMLALWHLFSGTPADALPPEVRDVAGGRALPPRVRRVALVGTHLPPAGGVKPGGTQVGTIWGELAWQLGGAPAFATVADADAARTNPGRLRELVAAHAPCLILVDEWVAYARQLWGRDDLAAGTFDTQFTFAQALTEAVRTVPGALLLVSVPAPHDAAAGTGVEVGGPHGEEAAARLRNVVRRVADPWRHASAEESVAIVRRRLFTAPGPAAEAGIDAAAGEFARFYARHPGDFPREVTADPERYRARIAASYPLHPELLDRLYGDWSALERFQGTRGVLRLVGAALHALTTARDPAPLIIPGTVPLEVPAVGGEVTQFLPDAWQPVLDADVDGPASVAVRIDAERPALGDRAMTRRLARSIFLGSAPTLHSAHRGVERRRAWLGAAMPGDVVGSLGSAADLLAQRASHLYAEGDRSWFATRASVTRTAADRADGLRERPEEVWQEVVERLRSAASRQPGGFAGVHVAPASSADVPDTEDVRLVVLHPSLPHARGAGDTATSPPPTPTSAARFAADLFEHRGTTRRANRNMVVVLAPDARRLDELADATRELLAWRWVHERREELGLPPDQVGTAEANLRRADAAVDARIDQAYGWVLVPDQPDPRTPPVLAAEKADGGGRLAERVTGTLARAGLLADAVVPRSLRLHLDAALAQVWDRGHVTVGQLWRYHCRHPYLARLRDRGVLDGGVAAALTTPDWERDGFALAEGYDEASGRYVGLVLPGDGASFGAVTDATLLVAPDRALAQAAGAPGVGEGAGAAAPAPAANTRFAGVYRVDPARHGRDLTRLSQEVLQQLAAADGVELDVTVEVHARRADGFGEDTVRVVLENAHTLRFERAEFEDG